MAASFVTFLFLSAQPSPERICSQSIEQLCHTCETLLGCALVLGFAIVLGLPFLGARGTANQKAFSGVRISPARHFSTMHFFRFHLGSTLAGPASAACAGL